MRFLYFALAIETNTNDMYMQLGVILPILHFLKIIYFMGHIKRKKYFLLHIYMYWLVGHKSSISVTNANLVVLSAPTPPI